MYSRRVGIGHKALSNMCLLIAAAGAICQLPNTIAIAAAEGKIARQVQGLDQIIGVDGNILDETHRKTVKLTLQDCIERTLTHNLDIKVRGYDPAIRLSDLIEAQAVFDTTLFGSAQFSIVDRVNQDSLTEQEFVQIGNTLTPVDVPSRPFANTHDYNYAVGLRKRLPTGAIVEASQLLRRYRDLRGDEVGLFLNPYHEYAMQLQLRQPLLRDFGVDVNRASIKAAKNNYRISQQQFHLTVISTLREVETNYWGLVLARQQVNIFAAQLDQAEQSYRKLLARKNLDIDAEMIYRNKGLTERTKASMVAAKSSVLQRQDQLLESINDPNLPIQKEWEIIPTDLPATSTYQIEPAEAFKNALQLRPELIAQKLQLDTAKIAVGVAENQLLPRLDVFAQPEITGAGDSYGQAWDKQWQAKNIDYLAGVSFEVPIGNRAAQAALTRTKHEYQQTKTQLDNFNEQVIVDVSVSIHNLQNSFKEILARQNAAQAETNTLKAHLAVEESEAKITSDFFDRKLNQQERLTNALLNAIESIFRYNVTIVELHRAQGTLLQYNNVKMEEMPN